MNKAITAERANWIRPLPERLVNKIAAGEVIERPASVLKELVENACDAGATQVDVIVEKSGVGKIEVHDNGSGIRASQLEIAFSRHATSKISDFADLESITSYGFRGEALPSIASVSRLRMITKSAEDDHASEIIIEGGVVRDLRPSHRADGTSVVIEDLFFNTPARKKFLKAETTEARQLSRAAISQALGALGVGFSLRLNGRKVFSFSKEDSLRSRATRSLGVSEDSLLEIDVAEAGFRLWGALGKPDVARAVRGGLTLYVNRRALRSSPLLSAFYLGYGELLPKGVFPIGAVHLDVDGSLVDVNVHPAKNEVRLSRDREAHTFIRHAVRDTLRQSGIIPEFGLRERNVFSAQFDKPSAAVSGFGAGSGDAQGLSPATSSATDAIFGRETSATAGSEYDSQVLPSASVSAESVILPGEDAPVELFEAGVVYLGQFANLYLLAQSGSDLYLVDQHAAHERILYEETMAQMERNAALSQRLLLPVNVELSTERFLVWEECAEDLAKIGFDATHFGGQTVMLNAIPAILAHRSPEKIFGAALDDIQRLQKSGYSPIKAVAQSIACRSAVMSGDRLDPEEGKVIIERLFKCDTGYSCPHGRPTFVKISRSELDKRFGRT
jgi:DNA mismatch repair protein MutL